MSTVLEKKQNKKLTKSEYTNKKNPWQLPIFANISLLSAPKGLTSVFGMGTGVPPSLSSPRKTILWK